MLSNRKRSSNGRDENAGEDERAGEEQQQAKKARDAGMGGGVRQVGPVTRSARNSEEQKALMVKSDDNLDNPALAAVKDVEKDARLIFC